MFLEQRFDVRIRFSLIDRLNLFLVNSSTRAKKESGVFDRGYPLATLRIGNELGSYLCFDLDRCL